MFYLACLTRASGYPLAFLLSIVLWLAIAAAFTGCALEHSVYRAELGAIASGEKPEAAGGDAAITHFVEKEL